MLSEILKDSDDLFLLKEEPFVAVEDEFGPSFFIMLRNFPLNSNVMRFEHIEVLSDRVVPFVETRVGFAEIYAMADRSGTRRVNYQVSGNRLTAVQRALKELNAPEDKIFHRFAKSIGEDFFEERGSQGDILFADGAQNAAFRTVIIALTPAPIGVPTRRFRQPVVLETVAFCRQHQQQA